VDAPAKRLKRQRKQDKFYTENFVVSGTSKRSKTRRLSGHHCLTAIDNAQQHCDEQRQVQATPEEQHHPPVFACSRSMDFARKNETQPSFVDTEHQLNPEQLEKEMTNLDLGEASDVSVLMNTSTMEELMNDLPLSPTSFLTTGGLSSAAEQSTSPQQNLAEPVNHRAGEQDQQASVLPTAFDDGGLSSTAEQSTSPQQNLAEPVNHRAGEQDQQASVLPKAFDDGGLSSTAEQSTSPQQNLAEPVNHRAGEQDQQASVLPTAFDDGGLSSTAEQSTSSTSTQNTRDTRQLAQSIGKTATRKKKRNPDQWKRNIRKTRKAKGQPHVNSTGKAVPAKEILPIQCKCRFTCSESFTAEARGEICEEYYALGEYGRQKDYILRNVIVRNVQSRKVLSRDDNGKEDISQSRQISVGYYLEYLGSRKRVCKSFFMKTLRVSNRVIMTAIEGRSTSGVFAKSDGRGRKPSVNKTDDEHVQAVKDHIQSFPTVESHYCRKETQRLYLDSKLTIKRMYELYVVNCRSQYGEAYSPVSSGVYRKIFTEHFNLGFYKPKKDRCSECEKFELMSASDQEAYKSNIEQHLERHREA